MGQLETKSRWAGALFVSMAIAFAAADGEEPVYGQGDGFRFLTCDAKLEYPPKDKFLLIHDGSPGISGIHYLDANVILVCEGTGKILTAPKYPGGTPHYEEVASPGPQTLDANWRIIAAAEGEAFIRTNTNALQLGAPFILESAWGPKLAVGDLAETGGKPYTTYDIFDGAYWKFTTEFPETPPSQILMTGHMDVFEDKPAGTVVGKLSAIDDELPADQIKFEINEGDENFKLIRDTLVTKRPFHYDISSTRNVTVTATDSTGHSIHRHITIHVLQQEKCDSNISPVAVARVQTNATVHEEVVLDGRDSSDADLHGKLRFTWKFTAVPPRSSLTNDDFINPNGQTSSFVPDVSGDYAIELVVADTCTNSNDHVVISANVDCSQNHPPVVTLKDMMEVGVDSKVTLSGQASDADAYDFQLNFQWNLQQVPVGSEVTQDRLALNVLRASFIPDRLGDYVLSLTVSDSCDSTTVVSTVHSVVNCFHNSPPIPRPSAAAVVNIPGKITLDASSSTDLDSYDILHYEWNVLVVPDGSKVGDHSIVNSTSEGPTVVPDVPGRYKFALRVLDSCTSATRTVEVDAVVDCFQNSPPEVEVNLIEDLFLFQEARLRATFGDQDWWDEGHVRTFWSFVQQPPSSFLENKDLPDSLEVPFYPDAPGVWTLQFSASDACATTNSTTSFAVTVACPDNEEPMVELADGQGTVGETAVLDASRTSDPDAYDGELSFEWSLQHRPVKSRLSQQDAFTQVDGKESVVSFVPDFPGLYRISLTVTDSCHRRTILRSYEAAVNCTLSRAPYAIANMDNKQYAVASTVVMDASKSYDPDVFNPTDTLTYLWEFNGIPQGSTLADDAISKADSRFATFKPDAIGLYVVKLTVGDGCTTNFTRLMIDIQPNCTSNHEPSIVLATSQSGVAEKAVILDASQSTDIDEEDMSDGLEFSWKFEAFNVDSIPLPMDSRVSDKNFVIRHRGAVAEFIPDVPGTYYVHLSVSDKCVTVHKLSTVYVNVDCEVDVKPTLVVSVDTPTPIVGETIRISTNGTSDSNLYDRQLSFDLLDFASPFYSRVMAPVFEADNSISFIPDVDGDYAITISVADMCTQVSKTVVVSVVAATDSSLDGTTVEAVDSEERTDDDVDAEERTDDDVDAEERTDDEVDAEERTDDDVDAEERTDEDVDAEERTDEDAEERTDEEAVSKFNEEKFEENDGVDNENDNMVETVDVDDEDGIDATVSGAASLTGTNAADEDLDTRATDPSDVVTADLPEDSDESSSSDAPISFEAPIVDLRPVSDGDENQDPVYESEVNEDIDDIGNDPPTTFESANIEFISEPTNPGVTGEILFDPIGEILGSEMGLNDWEDGVDNDGETQLAGDDHPKVLSIFRSPKKAQTSSMVGEWGVGGTNSVTLIFAGCIVAAAALVAAFGVMLHRRRVEEASRIRIQTFPILSAARDTNW